MAERTGSESRKLLGRLREAHGRGQPLVRQRLDQCHAADCRLQWAPKCARSTCFATKKRLELCATEGLNPEAVHQTRMRVGEGLGRAVWPMHSADRDQHGRMRPRTPRASGTCRKRGKRFTRPSCGVPIQRLGENLGVLVVQSKDAARHYLAKTRSMRLRSWPWCWRK